MPLLLGFFDGAQSSTTTTAVATGTGLLSLTGFAPAVVTASATLKVYVTVTCFEY